jgi:LacI family transcriptional regulator
MHTGAKRIDVAKAAGVSGSTVSRALADSPLISAEVKERVRSVARQLEYFPNIQASNFAKSRTYRLGFVVRAYKSFPPFSRVYFPTVLDGAVLTAEQRGYSITVILDKTDGNFKDLVEVVKSRHVDGLMILVIPIQDPRVDDLLNQKVPFVLVNDYRENCFSADSDPHNGMREAFEQMIAIGHQRFGFLTGDMNYRNATDRLGVFEKLSIDFSVERCVAEGDFSRTSGYRNAGKLLQGEHPPTCVMTSSDRQALGVLDYCREHGIHVPNDISVIGYDNMYPAIDVTPPLSTIDNMVQQTGSAAANLLIDRIENNPVAPVIKRLETKFVARQSTGPCKKGAGNG